MTQRCLACGVEKDPSAKEVDPFAHEDGIVSTPIEPLITIDCEGRQVPGQSDWRVVTVCHACFHKLDADLWISDDCWRRLDPVTPFDALPKLKFESKGE